MPPKKSEKEELSRLAAAIASGAPERLYIFYGEERYLLEHRLSELKKLLCPDGTDSFNYRRFDGQSLAVSELRYAVNSPPFFSGRTMVEVHDYDIFKLGDDGKKQVAEMLGDLPEYVCLVFVYDTVQYKPDGRQKLTGLILKHARVVEFAVQEQAKLVKWIKRHFGDCGKRIGTADAEYLAFITGGYMSALAGEIEKISAYSDSDEITRRSIDAVAEPVLDAVAYKLTDAITRGSFKDASMILDELLRMREAPHKLMFGISLRMRQLLAASLCRENGMRDAGLMEMCGIRYAFQAKSLLDAAGRISLKECRDAVLACCETARELNSSPDPDLRIIELVIRLTSIIRGVTI